MNLSICTTIKNRSKVNTQYGDLYLFPNCIESLANTLRLNDDVELIIADWESTDWPIIDWIGDKLPNTPIEIITVKHKNNEMSIGKGRNIAASHATKDVILFLDADMLIETTDSLLEGYKTAKEWGHLYPQVLYQKTYNKNHWEVHEGGGNIFIRRDFFEQTGGWPEYWGYGFEDIDFAQRVKDTKEKYKEVLYVGSKPIFHQWHPQQFEWKNRYASKDEKKKEQIKEVKQTHQKQLEDDMKILEWEIEHMLKDNPHTTHSKLKVAKGEDKRIL